MSDDYRAIIRRLRATATPEQAEQIQRLEDAFNTKVIGIADRAQVLEWGRDERVDHAFEQIDNTNVLVSQLITAFGDQRAGLQEFVTAQTLAFEQMRITLGEVARGLGKLQNDVEDLNIRHGSQIEQIVERLDARDTLADNRWEQEQEFQHASTADRQDLRDRMLAIESLLEQRPEQRAAEHAALLDAAVHAVLVRLAERASDAG